MNSTFKKKNNLLLKVFPFLHVYYLFRLGSMKNVVGTTWATKRQMFLGMLINTDTDTDTYANIMS